MRVSGSVLNFNLTLFLLCSGWPSEPSEEGEAEERALQWKQNHAVVCSAMYGTWVHPPEENSPSRSQVSECFLDKEQLCSTRWLRHLEGSRKHKRCCTNSVRHAILHVSRSVPVQALFLQLWRVVTRLHSLRALHALACVLWGESVGSRVQDRLG